MTIAMLFFFAMFHTLIVLSAWGHCAVCVSTPSRLLMFIHPYFSQDSSFSPSLSTKHPSLTPQRVSQLLSVLPYLICPSFKSLLFISSYTFKGVLLISTWVKARDILSLFLIEFMFHALYFYPLCYKLQGVIFFMSE